MMKSCRLPLWLWLLAAAAMPAEAARALPPVSQRPDTGRDCVILLHGLARTKRAMQPLARLLAQRGYAVVNLDYPSTRHDIEALARDHLAPVVDACRRRGHPHIHFVGHSLGGIVVRQYFQAHDAPAGSRMVMLGPPNRGSEVAQWLRDFFLYRWIMGPAGQQLGASADSLPNRLGPVPMEIGVIAGTFSINPVFSRILPGPDDGKVSLDRTRLKEMADFLSLPCSHGFLPSDREAMRQTVHFLAHGTFDR